MASMKRIPKYTAGMFKKKMPRFGAAPIKKPRMPRPPKPSVKKPRVKKFQEGGSTDDLVPRSMLPDRSAEQEKRSQRNMEELMKYYMSDEARERERERSKKRKEKSKESVIEEQVVTPEAFQREMEAERRRQEAEERARRKAGIRTARSGGVMRYDKGGSIDGCAVRGKTRGRFV